MDLYAAPRIVRTDRPDGSVLLSSSDPVPPHPVRVTDWLRTWAAADPDHPLIAERGPDGGWRRHGYGEVLAAANAIGQALLDRGLSARRPLMILSGNSIGHLLMTLGALTVGVPDSRTSGTEVTHVTTVAVGAASGRSGREAT